jgi:UDP-glucose 4-epimerase
MRVVVTGAAGFIGANLCRTLAAAGHDVIGLDDLSTGLAANLDGIPVTFHVGSILDSAVLDATLSDASAVVHLAARPSVPRSLADPVGTHEANASGTLQVLEAARRAGGPQVIVASSSSVYGANPTLPKHEGLVPMPVSPYAASKLAAESYALAWAQAFSLDVLAFRFFNVFGPLQRADHPYAAVIPVFAAAALAGRPLPVHGDGQQSRDFTYVGTVCSVLADAVARRAHAPRPVNLAFGTRVTLLEVVAELEVLLDRPLTVEHLPPRAGDVRASQADQGRLRGMFPDVEEVPFPDGLRTTVEWMRQTTGSRA